MASSKWEGRGAFAAMIMGFAAFAACATASKNDGSAATSGQTGCNCPGKQVCDPDGGKCVDCVPGGSQCGKGKFCAADTKTCADGCAADGDCPKKCDPKTHQCVDCAQGADCPSGVCSKGACLPACGSGQECGGTRQCCSGGCVDLQTSLENCGMCAKPCKAPAHTKVSCVAGSCAPGGCEDGFSDCNLDPNDGCEWDVKAQGPCSCKPGEKKPCYDGPSGTENVGTCHGGQATCNDGGDGWGSCEGQVLPLFDACGDGKNNDCTGGVDDPPDVDGDGWNACQGDCCDKVADCTAPKLVNPGAFEVAGNKVDDDCDGKIDNAVSLCDGQLASNSAAPADYAKAIDLCQTTVENAPLPQKTWGLIGADLFRADGAGTPAADSKSIRTGFGSVVKPLQGAAITVLSTGVSAAMNSPNNANPAWLPFQQGKNMGTTSNPPPDWLAANGGSFPNAPGCPKAASTAANDPVLLKLRVRVPTNAFSFSVSTYFYSSEYPEWVCSPYNDFFLALLDSAFVPNAQQKPNPADKNLAIYTSPANQIYPLGVNLAYGDTGLFKQCLNGGTGCNNAGGAKPGTISTCVGTTELAGTGFDVLNPPPTNGPINGWCGASNMTGGGTGWLVINGNVKPGEIVELRFVAWDTGDNYYDSVVLLDNFKWSVDASDPGVHPAM